MDLHELQAQQPFPEEALTPDNTPAKRAFRRIAFALFAIAAASTAAQVLFSAAYGVLLVTGSPLAQAPWMTWVITFLPLYAIGFPVGLLLLRRVPADPGQPAPLGIGRFWMLLLMCLPVMYGGNLLGTFLSLLLSGGEAENALLDYASDPGLLGALIFVVAAPLLEELVFRKQLIDRCSRYGEKTAILFSGLTFGLFHMNLFQFFYAFGLGLFFAYVYTRTRRLRYPFLMHAIVNFMGTVLSPWILSLVDLEALEALEEGSMTEAALVELLPGLLVYLGYAFLLLILSAIGLILLLSRFKKAVFLPAPEELPREGRGKTVFGNLGFALFAGFCLVFCVLSLL